MRSSQLFGSNNTLLSFTNTGFRTIEPGDAVLLGYDGNVSAPLYKANYPVTYTASGTLYTKNSANSAYLAGFGKQELAGNSTNRDFVYDAETDSLYGYLDGASASDSAPYWTRISRTNGNLNTTAFSVLATGANNANFTSSGTGYVIDPSQPLKIFDNGGTSDIWMVLAGNNASATIVTCNGSTGAMISAAVLVTNASGWNIPFIKVQNGYGVSSGATAGGLQAFSVSSTGAITTGANQPVATLGITAGGAIANVDLVPLGNTGTFLYFRADIGAYGTMYIATLNTAGLTFTVNATYALTAAQANYTGRSGYAFMLSPLNANNQIVLYQYFAATPTGSVVAGALTLLTYAPGTKTMTIGNVVPILGSNNAFVSTPTPTPALSRRGSGAHSYYDGYNFYYVEANCHLKIPFTGAAITPNGIVAYSKAYAPLQGVSNSNINASGWDYASNASPAGIAYIPMFFGTVASTNGTYAEGYWVAAEESLDNTFAYGVEIGIAVTSAVKGAAVTVSVKSAKLSSPLGATGVVGALTENGAAIYVTPTQLYAIGDFDLVYPRLPGTLTGAVLVADLADASLNYTNGAPAYKNPQVNYGPMWNGLQNYSATKLENTRQSVFLMNYVNFAYCIAGVSGNYTQMAPLLMSFDGIFMPQAGYMYSSASNYYVLGAFDSLSTSLYALNNSVQWSFRNEFGFNRYDSLNIATAYTQFRYKAKD